MSPILTPAIATHKAADQLRHQNQPSAMLAMQKQRGCDQVPRGPRKPKVNVTKCHACHTKICARQSQPSAISATLATQKKRGCQQAPRLPRKWKVAVTKCHLPHKRLRDQERPSAPPDPTQCHKCHACHAKATRA